MVVIKSAPFRKLADQYLLLCVPVWIQEVEQADSISDGDQLRVLIDG